MDHVQKTAIVMAIATSTLPVNALKAGKEIVVHGDRALKVLLLVASHMSMTKHMN
jgi:hypothetical protein